MNKVYETRCKFKKDTKENWETNNPILLDGEIVVVTGSDGSISFKIGDGMHNYNDLDESCKLNELYITKEQFSELVDENGDISGNNIVDATITESKFNTAIIDKLNQSHTHSNKTILDSITDIEKANWDEAYDDIKNGKINYEVMTNINVNNVIRPGIYSIGSNVTGLPFDDRGILIVFYEDPCLQVCISETPLGVTDVAGIYQRRKLVGAWTEWKRLINNIISDTDLTNLQNMVINTITNQMESDISEIRAAADTLAGIGEDIENLQNGKGFCKIYIH